MCQLNDIDILKLIFCALSLCLSVSLFLSVSLPEIIDDLSHLVDKTDDRIRNETRRVKLVETKSASCGELLSADLVLPALYMARV